MAYEYQNKPNNLLGQATYRYFLVFNGLVGPFVLGAAVATFFTGSAFHVDHNALGVVSGEGMASPVISQWDSGWHGLEALANPWNWVLGLAVLFLSRVLGALYLLNRNQNDELTSRLHKHVLVNAIPFLVLFVAFVVRLLLIDGLTYQLAQQQFVVESSKYWHNFMALPLVSVMFILGVVLVLIGIAITLMNKQKKCGIWWVGIGTVLAVMTLLLISGLNNTAYYPSVTDIQSSLCLANSCSSEFTLSVMAVVSLLIPFVLAYIVYAWWAIERKS